MLEAAQLKFINEETLLVEFGEELEDSIYQRVLNLDAALSSSPVKGILETMPTFRSLLIRFDVTALSYDELLSALSALNATVLSKTNQKWRVPVCFEGESAEDLSEVAGILTLDPQWSKTQ